MKWLSSFFVFCAVIGLCAKGMQSNILILDGREQASNDNYRDIRFCCPYCFDKFILKQIFYDHLLTHPQAVINGPIPGHTSYMGIYSTSEEIKQKMTALQQALKTVEIMPQ